MFIRPKLFLTSLGLCLVPLLLLASINYWNGGRIAEAALQRDQENDLGGFTHKIRELLYQDQDELTAVSQSKQLHDYIKVRGDDSANGLIQNSDPKGSIEETKASNILPVELRVRVASILNSRSHFARISLFDQKRHPLFLAERGTHNADEPVIFRTRDFLSEQIQIDNRVWNETKSAALLSAPLLISSVSTAPSGAQMDYAVPIFPEKSDVDAPQGALVGRLTLDPIFSEAARENAKDLGGAGVSSKPASNAFIIFDGSGRILYHSNEALKHQLISESMPYFLPAAKQIYLSEKGTQYFTGPDGDRFSVQYVRIPVLGAWAAIASNYEQALGDARLTGKTGFIAAVLLSLLAAALLALYWQRQARGFERVTQGVAAIAKGKLDHRIELQSSDDLRPLADNLGLMTKQLRDQIAREAETRQFQSFVRLSAMLTHDLKNAIEALSLTVSNMESHFDNKDFRADAMKSVTGATNNLRALVARLSNPVTTLSGEHKRPQPVDLVPILKHVISMIAEPARGKHEIKIDLPEFLFALVDSERMNKVIENLIINALEAMNKEKGVLSISAGTTNAGKPYFSVSDTGEGMTQRFIEEKLFRPFATTKRRGVGLGLYTCREVVVANGGSIEVDSQEGVGTTFRVVLPSAAIDKSGEKQPHSQSHS